LDEKKPDRMDDDVKFVRPDPFSLTPEQWAELENAAVNGRYYIKTRTVTREEFAAMYPSITSSIAHSPLL
jgi:hypothetical protein